MPLPLLNVAGPAGANATGMAPPLMRAMAHVGFAVAVGDTSTDDQWAGRKDDVIAELAEAQRHLADQNDYDHESNPFAPLTVHDAIVLLRDQFGQLQTAILTDSREDTFTNLKTLGENCTYISAMLERFITGNNADEGRNP